MKKKLLDSSIRLISNNNNYTQDQLDIIAYGLEAIYLTITKMIVIFCISYFLGIIKEVITLLITYNIIRSQAFGIHASKSSYCLISSLIFFVGGTFICKYIVISRFVMLIISLICDACLFIYAPADTYKRPLINTKKRKRFKILSCLMGIIYTVLIFVLHNNYVANYLLVGMLIEVLMILPVTYKIFKLPYNNYKNYKYGV
ncbi:MAG: accessory gene regulator B family protein [Bacilli bacterium]|nr:accessory gene regulator B family protein [Bacilli bacterium]